MSKFCLISPVLVRCCAWSRDSFFAFSAALAVFAGCIGNAVSLGACLLCFAWAFFVFFVFFSCRFCLSIFLVLLLCCLRRPCGCVFCCFVALVCFAVGVRCDGEFAPCFVYALCRFACTCHV